MDRQIVYIDQNPLDTDQLNQSKNTLIALGMYIQAVLGKTTVVDGLACAPTAPASLQVIVSPGSIYSLENVDNTAYGSLAADEAHQIMKQGISLDPVTLNCPAPGTAGYSVNYLVQAIYQDTDTGPAVLPYYDSDNVNVAFDGPGGLGASQNTVREGQLIISAKAGVAATTGTQTTPAPDAGYTGLYVVTVQNTQTQITSPNIVQVGGAPFISEKLGDKISIPTGDARYLKIGSVTGRIRLTGSTTYYVATTGNDASGDGTNGNPWLTMQHAINYVLNNIDLNGNNVTIQVADGTYGAGIVLSSPFTGAGIVTLQGNNANPANCLVNALSTGATLVTSNSGAKLSVGGFRFIGPGSGSATLSATVGGQIYVSGPIEYGSVSNSHLNAQDTGSLIQISANDTVSGGAGTHMSASYGGEIQFGVPTTTTITGNPAFSVAFASAGSGSRVLTPALTITGSATGQRYLAFLNGVIITNGGSATFFPGSAAGVSATGGQYA